LVRWEPGEVDTIRLSISTMRLRDGRRRQIHATRTIPNELLGDPPKRSSQPRPR
jgi:hypothetical protein